MSERAVHLHRRRFLKTALQAGAVLAMPQVIPGSALGKDGAVPPSERIVLGGIGIGGRGSYVLGCFLGEPEVQFVAICDVRADRRESVKAKIDAKYGNQDCAMYRDFREFLARSDIDAVLITTGSNWHALLSIYSAKAGKDVYCEKPCTKNIAESLALAETFRRTGRVFQGGMQRRNLPHFEFAVELARRGKLGKLQAVHAHPGGMGTSMSGWAAAEPEPPKEKEDWDLWLGPAPWRPYNREYVAGIGGWLCCFDFNAGGGFLNWASHTVDLCQWANRADGTTPVEFEPVGPQRGYGAKRVVHARYANGTQLVMRPQDGEGWLNLGSCQVRFEGEDGWVETGDSGKIALYPESLRTQQKTATDVNLDAEGHVRDFFDCVKSRAQPACNADIARSSHVAGHAAAIAWMLDRKVAFDPVKEAFIGDDEANRMRTRPMRAPWRL